MDGGRQRAHRTNRRDVEDDSFSLANHLLVNRFGNREETVDVRVNHFVPRAIRGGGEVVAAIDRRVVDENVDAAPLLNQFARHLFHADAIDDRDFRIKRAVAVSFDLAAHFAGEIVACVVTESDVGALARKNIAHGRTDATRSTGNERAFSLKQKAHVAMCLLKLTADSCYDGRLNREKRKPVNLGGTKRYKLQQGGE